MFTFNTLYLDSSKESNCTMSSALDVTLRGKYQKKLSCKCADLTCRSTSIFGAIYWSHETTYLIKVKTLTGVRSARRQAKAPYDKVKQKMYY